MLTIMSTYQKVFKTFVFQNQQTHRSAMQDVYLDLTSPSIDLTPILNKYFPLKEARANIYDPQANSFVSFKKIGAQNGIFDRNVLQPSFILIRYRPQHSLNFLREDSSSEFEVESDRKDSRSKERTVAEVILLVKKWRDLHLNCTKPNNPKKKINLQQAAKMLAVSKKSLDDYYCQLRLAEMYHFQFYQFWDQKMGYLRNFVKESREEEERKKLKPHRHPKHLKIIDDPQFLGKIEAEIKREGQYEGEGSVKDQEAKREEVGRRQTDQSDNQQMRQINNLENEYYRGFSFLFDDPIDPFLNMGREYAENISSDQSNVCLF